MYPEFKKFVNLIGHEITISGHATLPKCDNPCYVETEQMIIGKLAGVPIAKTEFKKIINLPDSEDGTYYIVSRLSMDYVPFDREDVFCVDTGPTSVRDENGQVIAVTQLSI
jgi:hypothetical protein